jgi:16S rRNA (uracil1498-N3)-methyltransferase
VKAALAEGAEVRLGGAAARHVSRVLRLREGDAIKVFDGRGSEHGARITSRREPDVRIVVGPAADTVPESPLSIHLLQGICRSERMDLVIQKTTELGITQIQPVFTRRSVVRLDPDRARRRTRHWRGIAVAACEQCGRATLPRVAPPSSLDDALAAVTADMDRLLLDPGAPGALSVVSPAAGKVAVLIGPEGGLEPGERQAAIEAGFVPVSLGPRIMRTETAALAAVVLLQSVWGDLRPGCR